MLKLKVGKLTRRDLIQWLYARAEVVDGRIRLRISPEITAEITPDVIEEVFGLPRGSKEDVDVQLPVSAFKELSALVKSIPNLKLKKEKEAAKQTNNEGEETADQTREDEDTDEEEETDEEDTGEEENGEDEEPNKDGESKKSGRHKVGSEQVKELMELMQANDVTTEIRCFLVILMNRMLLLRIGFYVSRKQAKYAWDLELVKKLDWCQVVYNDLESCILDYKTSSKKHNMPGCVLLFMICFFEKFAPPSKTGYTTPRVLDYDTKKVQKLSAEAKKMFGGEVDQVEQRRGHVPYCCSCAQADMQAAYERIMSGQHLADSVGFLSDFSHFFGILID